MPDPHDRVEQVTSLLRPLMHQLKLLSAQAAPPIVSVGSHDLRHAHRSIDSIDIPGLRHEAITGYNFASGGIFDHGEV